MAYSKTLFVFVSLLCLRGQAQEATQTIKVDSQIYATRGGHYVKMGDIVSVRATGDWFIYGGTFNGYNVAGHPTHLSKGCPFGSLVAQIGFFKTSKRHCLGAYGEFTADRDGILYLLPNDGWWQDDNFGVVSAELASNAAPLPVLNKGQVASSNLNLINTNWVELEGEHSIFSVPLNLLKQFQGKADTALESFDQIYKAHKDLSGVLPFNGQKIRYFPDSELESGVFAYMGNPVRYTMSAIANPNNSENIFYAGQPDGNIWGWAHELGHNFIFETRCHDYFCVGGEGLPNIFTMHAYHALGYAKPTRYLKQGEEYLNRGVFKESDFSQADIYLHFMMAFTDKYGWDVWKRYFRIYKRWPLEKIPTRPSTHLSRLKAMKQILDLAAGENTQAIFEKYFIPL